MCTVVKHSQVLLLLQPFQSTISCFSKNPWIAWLLRDKTLLINLFYPRTIGIHLPYFILRKKTVKRRSSFQTLQMLSTLT